MKFSKSSERENRSRKFTETLHFPLIRNQKTGRVARAEEWAGRFWVPQVRFLNLGLALEFDFRGTLSSIRGVHPSQEVHHLSAKNHTNTTPFSFEFVYSPTSYL